MDKEKVRHGERRQLATPYNERAPLIKLIAPALAHLERLANVRKEDDGGKEAERHAVTQELVKEPVVVVPHTVVDLDGKWRGGAAQ